MSERMIERNVRMAEIIFSPPGHTEPFHHPSRASVVQDRHGQDFVEPEIVEGEVDRGMSCFRCITLSPGLADKTPTHLHARGKMGMKGRSQKPGKADEGSKTRRLQSPPAEPMAFEMRVHTSDQRLRLRVIQTSRKVAHDLWIGIHRGKGVDVARTQSAKDQALGS